MRSSFPSFRFEIYRVSHEINLRRFCLMKWKSLKSENKNAQWRQWKSYIVQLHPTAVKSWKHSFPLFIPIHRFYENTIRFSLRFQLIEQRRTKGKPNVSRRRIDKATKREVIWKVNNQIHVSLLAFTFFCFLSSAFWRF